MNMYLREGSNLFTEENLVKLWHSVGWVEGSAENPKRLLNSLKNSDTVYSAWVDDVLAGLCSALTDGLNVWISYMVVDKKLHGLGIGTTLLKMMTDRYEGCRIYVQTLNANKFYEMNGFMETMHSMKMDRFLPNCED